METKTRTVIVADIFLIIVFAISMYMRCDYLVGAIEIALLLADMYIAVKYPKARLVRNIIFVAIIALMFASFNFSFRQGFM